MSATKTKELMEASKPNEASDEDGHGGESTDPNTKSEKYEEVKFAITGSVMRVS